LPRLNGKQFSVIVGDETSTVTVRPITKISLRTKNASEAKARLASVLTQIENWWRTARSEEISLPYQSIVGLAGIWYRNFVRESEAEPGSPEGWSDVQSLLGEGLSHLEPDEDQDGEPPNPRQGVRLLSQFIDLELFLASRGLSLNEATRTTLLKEVAWAWLRAARTLERRAAGDYGLDHEIGRFPSVDPSFIRGRATAGANLTLSQLVDRWAKETNPKQATVDLWRGYLAEFNAFIGHDDARSVMRQEVIGWKQHLLDKGNSVKTINDSKLAALKAIFGFGVENDLLESNPASRVSIRRSKRPGTEMQGFDLSEAAVILSAAAQSKSPVYHWVPLLCAQSGARVAEVCQLRAEDIKEEKGIWYMDFVADAGSLKNANSTRRVPLHPDVIAAGFVDFVRAKKSGPLFYDPTKRREGSKKPQPKIVGQNVAKWVHKLGIEVGREYRKDPNHAWRHLFRTLARDAGVAPDVADGITGHGSKSVGDKYGTSWLGTKAEAIKKISLPSTHAPEPLPRAEPKYA